MALAFKVVHDARTKRPVVWLRVYSGTIESGASLWNPRTSEEERLSQLQLMHGEEGKALQGAAAGSICAAVGMRRTRTGDTLMLRPRSAELATYRLPELVAPAPVFFSAVEVGSHAQQVRTRRGD